MSREGGNIVSTPSEVVREHLAALGRYDWTALERSVSESVRLQLLSVDSEWRWTLTGIYRFVAQAWDYQLDDVRLAEEGDGIVRAAIKLTNGGVPKEVRGEYCVVRGRIDAITLDDGRPRTGS